MINKMVKLLSFFVLLVIGIAGVNAYAQQGDICTSPSSAQSGYIHLEATSPIDVATIEPDFTAALLTSQEVVNGRVSAGADWFYRNDDPAISPTSQPGSQIVTYWTTLQGRNTYVQVTNTATDDPVGNCDGLMTDVVPAVLDNPNTDEDETRDEIPAMPHPTQHVRVQIVDIDHEIVSTFCDIYNPGDSHIYNLMDMTRNASGAADSVDPEDHGLFILTAVGECQVRATDDRPNAPSYPVDEHNFLVGNVRIIHPGNEAGDFGFNAYARSATAGTDSCEMACNGAVGTCLDDLGAQEPADPPSPLILRKAFNKLGTGANQVRGGVAVINFEDTYDHTDGAGIAYRTDTASSQFLNPRLFLDGEESARECTAFVGNILYRGLFPGYSLDVVQLDAGAATENCANGDDDDGDGDADCEDSDCSTGQATQGGMICCGSSAIQSDNGMCPVEDCGTMEDEDLDDEDGVCEMGCQGQSAGTDMICCGGEAVATPDDGMCPTTTPPPARSSDSDGCTVVGSASAGTATATILLPMMVFGLAFGLRRIRRRK